VPQPINPPPQPTVTTTPFPHLSLYLFLFSADIHDWLAVNTSYNKMQPLKGF